MPFALEPFLLIFARLSGLFMAAPIFSSRQIPVRFKIFIIVVLAAALAYFLPVGLPARADTPLLFLWAMFLEIAVGYTIGFIASLVLSGIQLAGQLMDMQLGFSIVNVVDPQSGAQIPLLGNLTQTLALLMYLAMNGHHYLLQGLVDSYRFVPVLGFHISAGFFSELTILGAAMFAIAVKVAAPVVIAVLTSDIAMGFINRTVPQMNVFIVGLPLKIIIGVVALLVLLPIYLWVFNILFTQLFGSLDKIIYLMGK